VCAGPMARHTWHFGWRTGQGPRPAALTARGGLRRVIRPCGSSRSSNARRIPARCRTRVGDRATKTWWRAFATWGGAASTTDAHPRSVSRAFVARASSGTAVGGRGAVHPASARRGKSEGGVARQGSTWLRRAPAMTGLRSSVVATHRSVPRTGEHLARRASPSGSGRHGRSDEIVSGLA
jgi:hypothetical protein